MKYLPVFLYALRYSPIWIPKPFFENFDSTITSFLCRSGPPRINKSILKRPWTEGGLACPDLQKYFFAVLLSHTHNLLALDDINAAVVLEAAHLGSYEALRNALYRGVRAPSPLTLSRKAVIRAWQLVVCKLQGDPHTRSPDTPLWLNPR